MKDPLIRYKVLDNVNDLPEGRVMTVTADHTRFCLTHYKAQLFALDNKCPHQGGPLGEGSIENGQLRCPWHGWDFCPYGGSSSDYDDGLETYPLKGENNVVFVGLLKSRPHQTTVSDIMMETMANWDLIPYSEW